ncbi:MAG: sigma-70 family RNA polymerase sigma factor [Nanoarchaeota archaeon]|nr:sigma-70 family RNA polymerase sigma factor [Nanoarchaeota archaeon]
MVKSYNYIKSLSNDKRSFSNRRVTIIPSEEVLDNYRMKTNNKKNVSSKNSDPKLGLFMHQMGQYRLLGSDEEVRLSSIIYGDASIRDVIPIEGETEFVEFGNDLADTYLRAVGRTNNIVERDYRDYCNMFLENEPENLERFRSAILHEMFFRHKLMPSYLLEISDLLQDQFYVDKELYSEFREGLVKELVRVASRRPIFTDKTVKDLEHNGIEFAKVITAIGKKRKGLEDFLELAKSDIGKLSQLYAKHFVPSIEARDIMINANQRLIINRARKFNQGDTIDLAQEGTLGLLRSVQKYDYRKGFKFSTYSVWWIRQSISRFLDSDGMIRLPTYISEKTDRITDLERELCKKLGREPTRDEIKSIILERDYDNLKVRDVDRVFSVRGKLDNVSSLDASVNDNDTPLSELIDGEFDTPEQINLEKRKLRIVGDEIRKILSSRELFVIERRYGLNGYDIMSLETIGKLEEMDVTRERIRQIQANALKKLRINPILKELFY